MSEIGAYLAGAAIILACIVVVAFIGYVIVYPFFIAPFLGIGG